MGLAPSLVINLPGYPFESFPSVATIALLRGIASAALGSGDNYAVDGDAASGDGGGGVYTWSTTSTATDDGSSIIRPTDTAPGQAGRWVLSGGLAYGGKGSARVGFDAQTAYGSGTVGGKLQQIKAVPDYATPAAADAAASELFVPSVTPTSLLNGGALTARYWGPGQIRTADGNKRGKYFSTIKAPPPLIGNSDSIDTAFNGDFAGSFIVEHRISGTGTLGTPTNGYVYRNEAVPFYAMMYVAPNAGHNEKLDGNDGRTGTAIFRGDVKHYGNGDAVVYNGSALVAGNKAGATSWLAQPAVVLFNGDMQAAAAHVYLNPRELHLKDNGYDIACIGDVVNLARTNGAGGQGVTWLGYRAQSVGSVAADAVLSATGVWKNGIDLSMSFLDFGANKSAISLKGGDRIYFNNASTSDLYTGVYNGDWIEFDLESHAIIVVRGGTPVIQIAANRITMLKPPVLPTITVSALPAANTGNRGMEYYVTDAAANTRHAAVTGGGSGIPLLKVFSNGTAWLIA